MPGDRPRVIRDPLYGYVAVPPRLQPLVEHPLFQRLRRVSQTSLATTVYPSMTGNRFEHSLGAMHLAQLAWASAWSNARGDTVAFLSEAAEGVRSEPGCAEAGPDDVLEAIGDAVSAVALLHDLGHPPYSHALEPFYAEHGHALIAGFEDLRSAYDRAQMHEVAGCALVAQLLDDAVAPGVFRALVWQVYVADPQDDTWSGVLHGLVDGEIDIDRLDYLLRDAQRAGTEFGAIDHRRLVDALELQWPDASGTRRIGIAMRGQSAVETVLVQRLQSYRWLFFHPWVVASDLFLLRCLQMIMTLRRPNERFADVAASFDELTPNLDYVSRTAPAKIPGFQGAGPDPVARPDTEVARTRLLLETQCSLDDAAVLEWVKRSSLLAQSYLVRGQLAEPLLSPAQRLVAYYAAAVHRRKGFVVAWRRFTEYRRLAEALAEGLGQVVTDAFADLVPEFEGTARQAKAEAQHRDAREAVEAGPIALLHHVAKFAVSLDAYRFSAAFTEQVGFLSGLGGFWEFTYRPFSAVRVGTRATKLYDGGEPVPLVDISPLVEALVPAEEQRVRMFGFYIAVPQQDLDDDTRERAAADARRRVVEHFARVAGPLYLGAQREAVRQEEGESS